jgi:hypothetical protein
MKDGHKSSKARKNEALNLADFEIDDILSTPGERLLAEVGEDFGDPMFLAAEFDAIALPILSGDPIGIGRAAMIEDGSAVEQAVTDVASRRAPPAASPSFPSLFRHAKSAAAERLAAPLRSRAVLGAFAMLLLGVLLALGVYPVNRVPVEQASERPPSVASPAPGSSAPHYSRQVVRRDEDMVEMRANDVPPPGTAPLAAHASDRPAADQGTATSPDRPPRTAPPQSALGESDSPPQYAQPALPRAEFAGALPPPAPRRLREAVAPTADTAASESSSYLVQLTDAKSESDAQSEFRSLQAKYSVLNGRQPVLRRMDEGLGGRVRGFSPDKGERGVFFVAAVGPFGAKGEADQVCDQIKAAGGTCYVYKDGGSGGSASPEADIFQNAPRRRVR